MINNKIFRIVLVGILSALSIVLVLYIHFPIFPAVAFLEYDPADIPIFLTTAFLGPVYGLIMTVVVSIIQGLTVSASSGWVGIIMHIFATSTFVIIEGIVLKLAQKKFKYGTSLIIATVFGAIAMTLAMLIWNLLFTPYFMHTTLDVVISLLPFILAFNAIKAGANGLLAVVLWHALKKPISKFIK